MTDQHSKLHPAKLARNVLHYYLTNNRMPELPDSLPPEYNTRAGVFVSLKKKGELRGCIGTFKPARDNLAEEIAANAVGAAVKDPRFTPVNRAELPDLELSVDILGPLERVNSKEELDPHQYGVMVRKGARSGLLLPDLEDVDTVEQQLEIAFRKAGIEQHEEAELYRFKVTRYPEPRS